MDRVTVWDGQLDAQERAALEPGQPPDLDRNPDVLVIGAGAIGLLVAVACRRAGLGRVVVLEQAARLGSAASGGNGGAIAPDMHLLTDSPEFVAFGRASLQLYRELDTEWDGAFGLWPTRWLTVLPDSPNVLPPEFDRLDAAGVRDIEPDVRLPEGGTALLLDGQLAVNPQRLLAVLSSRCGQIAAGVRMHDVTVRGDRIITVHTTAGDFSPGTVVIATGLLPAPWSIGGLPQRWIKGHMLAVAPGPWRLNSVLAGPIGGGTPLSDGSIVCGGTFDDGDLTPDVRPEIADAMAADLATILPAAAGAVIAHRWCCFRPYIEGRQPVVDRLPGIVNGWFAGGHFTTGIMMAAATGAATAEWIGGTAVPELVKTFTLR